MNDDRDLLHEMLSAVPPLNHEELKLLFIAEHFKSLDDVQHILGLPRETLIADLETIIRFGVEHTTLYDVDGIREDHNTMFVLHALFLLGEIGGRKTLDVILDFMQADPEAIDFWVGDHTAVSMPSVVADAARDEFEALKTLAMDDGLHRFCRVQVIAAVGLMYHRGKIEREVVQQIYQAYYESIQSEPKDERINLTTFLLVQIKKFYLHRLLDIADDAFTKNDVAVSVWKDQPTFEADYNANAMSYNPIPDPSFIERYTIFERAEQEMREMGYDLDEQDEELDLSDFGEDIHPYTYIRTEPKTGRNDPCPCGSGKKYKKCHGA